MSKEQNIALYIDPPSHHFLGDRLFDTNEARLAGDQLLAPYVYLRNFLDAKGIRMRTFDYLPEKGDGKKNVYVSFGILSNYQRLADTRPDVVLSAYFAMECPIVEPRMYAALGKAQRVFKRVYSWSDGESLERFVGEPLNCLPFRWPQSFDDVHEPIWSNPNRKFLVMINANKLPRLYWRELYTERMRAIEYFSQFGEVDLFGKGWNEPSMRVGTTRVPYTMRRALHRIRKALDRVWPNPLLMAAQKAYQGIAESKAGTLGQYKFALCFENSILKGWITEKIFDCFFAGTIPIYWGEPEIEKCIPPSCFVDMRNFSGYEELRSYLKSLTDADIARYKENARAFLRSPQFYPFSKAAFADLFASFVAEDTGVKI